jgi:ParB-like chromosome segregation protein Spo0J
MRTIDVPLQNIKPGLQTQQLLNRYDPDKVNEIAKKLNEEGQKEPIVLDATLTQIRDGFARYLAAKQLGWKTIKATVMTDGEWKKKQGLP